MSDEPAAEPGPDETVPVEEDTPEPEPEPDATEAIEGEGEEPPPVSAAPSQSQSQTKNTKNLSQSTRSYMFLDSAESSVLYEKDGNWVLEKVPDDIKDQIKTEKDTCMADPDHVRESHIVPIDALSGNETIPCNLCDKGQCMPESELAPAWLWMYDLTTQMITLANEYKRNMLLSDASCGESDNANANLEDRLVASKGTQHSTTSTTVTTEEPDPAPAPETWEEPGPGDETETPDFTLVEDN